MSSSDEEAENPPVKKQRLFYGSLEDQERDRLQREQKERLAAEELLRAQGSETSEEESDSDDDNKQKKKKNRKKKKKKGKFRENCKQKDKSYRWISVIWTDCHIFN